MLVRLDRNFFQRVVLDIPIQRIWNHLKGSITYAMTDEQDKLFRCTSTDLLPSIYK